MLGALKENITIQPTGNLFNLPEIKLLSILNTFLRNYAAQFKIKCRKKVY